MTAALRAQASYRTARAVPHDAIHLSLSKTETAKHDPLTLGAPELVRSALSECYTEVGCSRSSTQRILSAAGNPELRSKACEHDARQYWNWKPGDGGTALKEKGMEEVV